jgi:hypothetical protein
MSLLPQFSFDAVVKPVSTKHDKLTLTEKHRIYKGATDEKISKFRNHLCIPPEAERGVVGAIRREWWDRNFPGVVISEQWGRIFARGNASRYWIPLEARKVSSGSIPAPLINCQYSFRRTSSSDQSPEFRTELKLWPNVTEFIRNQNPQTFIPPRRNFAATSATFYEIGAVPTGDEYALDGISKNWIPDLPEFWRLHDPWFFERQLQTYLEGMMREIDSDATRAAELVGLRYDDINAPDRFTLHEVETFVDFSAPIHPIDLVRSLQQPLESYNQLRKNSKDYPSVEASSLQENCRVLSIIARPGVRVKFYPKTNRRFRLETTHNLRVAKFRSGDKWRTLRITAPDLNGISAILQRVRADAADVMNDVIRHLKGQNALPATPKTAVDLLMDIAAAVSNPEHARTIISILLDKGSVTSRQPLCESLGELRAAGIFRAQPRNGRREHVVTEQYQYALTMLREYGASPHLTARHRTRTPTQTIS